MSVLSPSENGHPPPPPLRHLSAPCNRNVRELVCAEGGVTLRAYATSIETELTVLTVLTVLYCLAETPLVWKWMEDMVGAAEASGNRVDYATLEEMRTEVEYVRAALASGETAQYSHSHSHSHSHSAVLCHFGGDARGGGVRARRTSLR
eukprot:5114465-Pyramimonas_sp.AAC.2